jgi:prephenate dehydrogenase
MRIAVVGAGNMGSWFVESLCLDYEVGVYDTDRNKLKYFFNSRKFIYLEELIDFEPDMLINAVSLEKTITVFEEIVPYLNENCIIADITSVKNGLAKYYKKAGRRFVSTHPMFGPTFANVRDLSEENAIIISESDPEGIEFFRKFYSSHELKIYEYSFEEHDKTIAYSLSIPFSSTLVFASCMKEQEAPGTTFKRHHEIARGLLSEDDYLLSEILLNPYSLQQVIRINKSLENLISMIKKEDTSGLKSYFGELRENLGMQIKDSEQ